jgi:hypothetical protein
MKGIDSTGAPLVHVPGWMEVKAVLRIAYSNQKQEWLTPVSKLLKAKCFGLLRIEESVMFCSAHILEIFKIVHKTRKFIKRLH